ncbi:hypothetical protein GCM10010532_094250 [Dactylosporangium siamense]|uniref:Uncharacterized protein n=1 Tax=Dactylosporangium siamense TaxID=685454 RepID=A0A919UC91_9ACTN|nr:hypothetical protein Dsi01nite_082700 [Dactylosporangium siamense]
MLDRLSASFMLAVLAVAFRPWWSVRVRSASWEDGRETDVIYTTYGRTAWQVSTRWTVAVLLVAAVAVVWLIVVLGRRRIPFVVRVLALGVIVVAVALTVAQWRGIESWPPPNAVSRVDVELGSVDTHRDHKQELADAWTVRDHLRSIHDTGLTADVTPEMWFGLATMSLTAVTLFAGMLARPRRTLGPDGPSL